VSEQLFEIPAVGGGTLIATEELATFRPRTDLVTQAFARALNAVEPVTKDETADTGRYKYRYVSLGAVLEEVKRVCQEHGLAISQIPSGTAESVTVTTMLIHVESGQVLTFDPVVMPMPARAVEIGGREEIAGTPMLMPATAQDVGGVITYARRYALVTLFAMEVEDDDAGQVTQAMRTPPPTFRSRFEPEIRRLLDLLPEEQRKQMQADFKEHFSSTLAQLPAARHEEALEWVQKTLTERSEQS
jgi:ERF superfamily